MQFFLGQLCRSWSVNEGIHPGTAYKMFGDGTLPVRAHRVDRRLFLVGADDQGASARAGEGGSVGLFVRVSSRDRKAGLDSRLLRLYAWAGENGTTVLRTDWEAGSGMNGSRQKIRSWLAGPAVPTVAIEHRDRFGRVNTELAESALAAGGRRLGVVKDTGLNDDSVRDVTEGPAAFCARLHGKRSARNRAARNVRAAQEGA